MAKTLVTGAAGFIGSAVVRQLLQAGREVRCLVEPGANQQNLAGLDVDVLEADINDRQKMGDALTGCDVLYHLAAIYKLWTPDASRIYEVNVEGTKTILWAAFKADLKKVVYTSSIAAIGAADHGGLADESTAFNLWSKSDAYIRSKWLSEREALRFADEGLPVTVVNPAFPLGDRDIGPTPTGRVIVTILDGRAPGYIAGGFNCVDVEDVAAGHLLAEQQGQVGERCILGGHNVTYKDFYAQVAEIGGVNRPRRKLPGPLFHAVGWAMEKYADHISHEEPPMTYRAARWASRTAWYDCTKAHTKLGMPVTPLAETIERSVRWFVDNGYVGNA